MEQGQGLCSVPCQGRSVAPRSCFKFVTHYRSPPYHIPKLLQMDFRNVSVNITDDIFIAVFPLPLIIQ